MVRKRKAAVPLPYTINIIGLELMRDEHEELGFGTCLAYARTVEQTPPFVSSTMSVRLLQEVERS